MNIRLDQAMFLEDQLNMKGKYSKTTSSTALAVILMNLHEHLFGHADAVCG